MSTITQNDETELEDRPSRIQVTAETVRVDVEQKSGKTSTSVMPLSNLVLFGHGELKPTTASWRLIAIGAFVALILTPIDDGVGALAWLIVAAVVLHKLLAGPETGLFLMTSSGYTRMFTSKNYSAISAITEEVFKIIENPEKLGNQYYQVSINGDHVSGNFVAGSVSGANLSSTGSAGQPASPDARQPPPPV